MIKLFGRCKADGKRHFTVKAPSIKLPGGGTIVPNMSVNPIWLCSKHLASLQTNITNGAYEQQRTDEGPAQAA